MTDNEVLGILHENYNAMLQWMVATQHGYRLDEYLAAKNYCRIAVYGMNEIGNCVVRELIDSDRVSFCYAIDQGTPKLYFDIPCFKLDEIPKEKKVDLIIVALPYWYDSIKSEIEGVTGIKTASITELVYEMDQ